MRNLFYLIALFFVFSPFCFAEDFGSYEYCSCDLPECKEPRYLNSVSEHLYLSHLLPMNLDAPKNDAKKRMSHGDYRLLKFEEGDALIRYSDKMTEDRYLACRLGIKEIKGFVLAPDVVIVEDPSGNSGDLDSYKEYFSKFKRYISEYNEAVMTSYFEGGIEGANEEERKQLFTEDRQVFELNWKLGGGH